MAATGLNTPLGYALTYPPMGDMYAYPGNYFWREPMTAPPPTAFYSYFGQSSSEKIKIYPKDKIVYGNKVFKLGQKVVGDIDPYTAQPISFVITNIGRKRVLLRPANHMTGKQRRLTPTTLVNLNK